MEFSYRVVQRSAIQTKARGESRVASSSAISDKSAPVPGDSPADSNAPVAHDSDSSMSKALLLNVLAASLPQK